MERQSEKGREQNERERERETGSWRGDRETHK